MNELNIRNRQRTRRLNVRLYRRIAERVIGLRHGNRPSEVTLFIVGATEMARINWEHLQHKGPTDVITFSYADANRTEPLVGDIFICIDEAIRQASAFDTTWQSELVRYFIHGLLHLEGCDDLVSENRRVMKREENRLVRQLGKIFPLDALQLPCSDEGVRSVRKSRKAC